MKPSSRPVTLTTVEQPWRTDTGSHMTHLTLRPRSLSSYSTRHTQATSGHTYYTDSSSASALRTPLSVAPRRAGTRRGRPLNKRSPRHYRSSRPPHPFPVRSPLRAALRTHSQLSLAAAAPMPPSGARGADRSEAHASSMKRAFTSEMYSRSDSPASLRSRSCSAWPHVRSRSAAYW